MSHNEVVTFTHARRTAVKSVAFSPDGRSLASGSSDTNVRLWDLTAKNTAAQPQVLKGHDSAVVKITFSPDGHWLGTISGDREVRLWDVSTDGLGERPIILQGHDGPISSIVFSPDSHSVITAGKDKTARRWDLSNEQPEALVLRGHDAEVQTLSISPVTLSGHGKVTDLMLVGGSITALAFSPDNNWFASCGTDGSARIWDLTIQNLAASLIVLKHRHAITSVAFSPDGRWLATGTRYAARLWSYRPNDIVELAQNTAGRKLTPLEEAYYVKLTSTILSD